jgi:hypothetical protein
VAAFPKEVDASAAEVASASARVIPGATSTSDSWAGRPNIVVSPAILLQQHKAGQLSENTIHK